MIGVVFTSIIFFLYCLHLHNRLELLQSQSMLGDLELATTDQLLKEFRSRPDNSYILLTPMSKDEELGMKIELNSFTPYDSVSLLHLAKSLIMREMISKGMDIPDLPSIDMGDEDGD